MHVNSCIFRWTSCFNISTLHFYLYRCLWILFTFEMLNKVSLIHLFNSIIKWKFVIFLKFLTKFKNTFIIIKRNFTFATRKIWFRNIPLDNKVVLKHNDKSIIKILWKYFDKVTESYYMGHIRYDSYHMKLSFFYAFFA